MERYRIPLLSLEDCSRVITEKTKGRTVRGETFATYDTPLCRNYSRSYLLSDFENTLDKITEGIRNGEPPFVSFLTDDAPAVYEDILENRGWRRKSIQTGMIFDSARSERKSEGKTECIRKADAEAVGEIRGLKGCEVRRIQREEISDWEQVLYAGFGPIKLLEKGVYDHYYDIPGVFMYGFFDHGKIVGTSLLIENGELSGIHEVTVLPDCRGKGACTAMILKILEDLRKAGMETVSLQASAMGKPVYERLGFETVSILETWRMD